MKTGLTTLCDVKHQRLSSGQIPRVRVIPFALVFHRGIIMAAILKDYLRLYCVFLWVCLRVAAITKSNHVKSPREALGQLMVSWQLDGLKRLPKQSREHISDVLFYLYVRLTFNH